MSATIAATSRTEPWSAVDPVHREQPDERVNEGLRDVDDEPHDVVAAVGDEQHQDYPQTYQQRLETCRRKVTMRSIRRRAGLWSTNADLSVVRTLVPAGGGSDEVDSAAVLLGHLTLVVVSLLNCYGHASVGGPTT